MGITIGTIALYFLESKQITSFIPAKTQDANEETQEDGDEYAELDTTTATETAADTTTTFEGIYISAELPQGWTIVEYNDENGSNMIMSGITYSGLVGLKVFNANNDEMFYLKAVDGIGGLAGCDEVYEFSDTDPAYLADGNDTTSSSGITPTVVDLTAETYSEYDIFNHSVRRIERFLYRDAYDSLYTGFNPGCGIDTSFFEVTSLGYDRVIAGVSETGTTYTWEIPSSAPLSDLETLDDVLENLSVN